MKIWVRKGETKTSYCKTLPCIKPCKPKVGYINGGKEMLPSTSSEPAHQSKMGRGLVEAVMTM